MDFTQYEYTNICKVSVKNLPLYLKWKRKCTLSPIKQTSFLYAKVQEVVLRAHGIKAINYNAGYSSQTSVRRAVCNGQLLVTVRTSLYIQGMENKV